MDHNEKQMIDTLFGKLGQAERQSGPRDPAAEQAIAEAIRQQPAAPYYMAQAILVQENALASLNRRVEELERELAERPAAGGGSFLSGLFGVSAGQTAAPARPAASGREPVMPPGASMGRGWSTPAASAAPTRGWSAQPQGGGSGFLGSALQTAAGVAGGVLLASAVSGLFAGEEAKAAEPAAHEPPPQDPDANQDPGADDLAFDDGGGDFGDLEEF